MCHNKFQSIKIIYSPRRGECPSASASLAFRLADLIFRGCPLMYLYSEMLPIGPTMVVGGELSSEFAAALASR